MAVLEFESKNPGCYMSEVKKRTIDAGPLKGYDEYYQEIYNDGILVVYGDLVYVKDRSLDDWIPARFVGWMDEGIAIVDNKKSFWKYMKIPRW